MVKATAAEGLTAAELRTWRMQLGLSQSELAARIGVAANTIARWERGSLRMLNPVVVRLALERIASGPTLGQTPDDRASAAPNSHPRHNLPSRLDPFFGRAAEIADIVSMLRAAQLVTLIGVGGVGKSRLAMEVARQVLDEYPDGTWMAELAALTEPRLVAYQVAAAVGIRPRPGQSPLSALLDGLSARRVLLILDNCEHLLAACAELITSLVRAAPGLHILATTRERLEIPGELAWQVASLNVPAANIQPTREQLVDCESVQLFIDRVRALQNDFVLTDATAPHIAEICRGLDGIPLAIELAAASATIFGTAGVAARLNNRFELLVGRGSVPRHRTLRAVLDWSYALLSEVERRLFERAAVFAAGWTLEAAEQVCTDESCLKVPAIAPSLRHLVACSLVHAEPLADGTMRYRMLETVRQYAAERLTERGEADRLYERNARYVVDLAEQAGPALWGPQVLSWLRRLERDHDNIRAALRWMIDAGEIELAQRLGATIGELWMHRGLLAEGRSWLAELRALPGEKVVLRLRLDSVAGVLALVHGDRAEAWRLLSEVLGEWRAYDSPRDLAYVLLNLAFVVGDAGRLDEARAYAEEGLEMSRGAGDHALEAFCLERLGQLALQQGELERAAAHLDESVGLATAHGVVRVVGYARHTRGWLSYNRGDYAAARLDFDTSRAAFAALDERWGQTIAHAGYGHAAAAQGDLNVARTRFLEILGSASEPGNPLIPCFVVEGFAHLAQVEGRPEQALRLAGCVTAALEARGMPASPRVICLRDHWRAARMAVGRRAGERAWQAGRLLSLEATVAEIVSAPATSIAARRPPGGLTPRELEVALLVADGKSNRQIAQTLVVSERTVARHIDHILAKLAVRSRAAAAALIVRAGLS